MMDETEQLAMLFEIEDLEVRSRTFHEIKAIHCANFEVHIEHMESDKTCPACGHSPFESL